MELDVIQMPKPDPCECRPNDGKFRATRRGLTRPRSFHIR